MNNNKSAEEIFDDAVEIGFQNEDGFKEIEDARFSYFSKYSNSQLDEIYEWDVRAREIIDKIRSQRASWN